MKIDVQIENRAFTNCSYFSIFFFYFFFNVVETYDPKSFIHVQWDTNNNRNDYTICQQIHTYTYVPIVFKCIVILSIYEKDITSIVK